MIPTEIGYVFLYVAAFGFSDYFVKVNKLKGFSYLFYYTIILIISIALLIYTGNINFSLK